MLDRVRSYVILKPREFGREQLFLTKEVMKSASFFKIDMTTCFSTTKVVLTPKMKSKHPNWYTTKFEAYKYVYKMKCYITIKIWMAL